MSFASETETKEEDVAERGPKAERGTARDHGTEREAKTGAKIAAETEADEVAQTAKAETAEAEVERGFPVVIGGVAEAERGMIETEVGTETETETEREEEIEKGSGRETEETENGTGTDRVRGHALDLVRSTL